MANYLFKRRYTNTAAVLMYPIKKTDWWEIIARRMELKEEDDHSTEHIGWPHR